MDEERGHYQLLYLGWDLTGRVFAVVCHMRLRDGKVWIERDGTPDGVATALLEAALFGPSGLRRSQIASALTMNVGRVW